MLWIYLEKVSYIRIRIKNVAVNIKIPFQNSFDFCRFLLYTRKLNKSLKKEALKLWIIKKEILLTIKQDIIHTILVNASIDYIKEEKSPWHLKRPFRLGNFASSCVLWLFFVECVCFNLIHIKMHGDSILAFVFT